MKKSFVFVSGACGGVGKAFSLECAMRGWNLLLNDHPDNESVLRGLSESLSRTYGIEVVWKTVDLTDFEDRTRLLEFAADLDINLHMMIHIAGVEYEGLFLERSREQISRLIRLNIESTVDLTRALFRLRDPRQTFRVITISSLAAFYAMPVKALYSASKRFLLNFFRAFNEELRPLNGSVTVLCPAGMPTTAKITASIADQGAMGALTAFNTGTVAHKTMNAALRGKFLVIPGVLNRVLKRVGLFLPPGLVTCIIGRRWMKRRIKDS